MHFLPSPLHILLVEDSDTHAELIGEALSSWRSDLQLTVASSVAEARAVLRQTEPHLALVDLSLPDGKGTELLSNRGEQAAFPTIVLTGSGDEQTAVEVMKAGALDYLVKGGGTLADLPPIIERTLRLWDQILRRREAEEAMRRSEEKYRRLFENMQDALAVDEIILDDRGRPADWRIVDVNPAYEEILGVPRAQARGGVATEVYGTQLDHESMLKVCARVVETGRPEQLELLLPDSGKHLLISIFSLGNGYFATLSKDVTESHRMQEALRESEERFRSTFEQAPVGIALVTRERQWLWVNRKLCDIFGYTREELHRIRFREVSHPEDYYADREEFIKLLKGELSEYSLERRYIRKDGTVVWGNHTMSAVQEADGTPKYLIGIVEEVTERKQAEAERERLIAELEATLNAIADAVVIYGPEGHIRHLNPAAENLLGYSAEDLGKPLEERISRFQVKSPDGQPFPLEETMRKVIAGEKMQGVLAVVRRPDGRDLWLSNSAAPIYLADGRRVGAVGTSTDITELHDLQEEREQYLHTISHDLRVPLTVIQGYGQLLQETLNQIDEGKQLEGICDELLKGVGKMTRMIDDLVDTARLEGGKIQIEAVPLQLESFLKGLEGSWAEVLDCQRLKVELPENLPPVMADPDHLERILMNLLTNACKYSPPDSPVELRARRQNGEVEIAVRDRGRGIAPEDQAHLFDRFFRPGGESRRDSVGLGLYITRRLVESLGGRIWVESTPGEGSTFTFTLPVA